MEAYLGSVFAFGFNYPPVGWALCNGQLLSVADNQPLFTLLGTTYGGDGVNTFGLPDLQGRMPIGTGQGLGLQNYILGQKAGVMGVTLTTANIPPHTHQATTVVSVGGAATANVPTGGYFATSSVNVYETTSNVVMATNTANTSFSGGGGQPIEIQAPYMTVNYCICTQGLYPTPSN